MNSDEEKRKLREAIMHPKSDLAKQILQKYRKHFSFCGKDINYGAMEANLVKSYILETQKRMQSPFCFLTLNMEEMHNPRSIRACATTVDNKHFPAIFERDCPYGKNGTEFMEHLRTAGETVGEGKINFSEAARAQMAMDDPVTFVEETKQMLNDVCSILLGIPPEDFYSAIDSESRRKTRYFKCNKGVFGNCLAYVGVTEDHKKGTLHFHILIFGGISAYAMQRFASMPRICEEISKVLDSMFKTEIPSQHHLPALIHRIAEDGNFPLALPLRSREVLLSRPSHDQAKGPDGKITHQSVANATYDQASRQCHHRHLKTCHKGYHGRTGCRLCMKAGRNTKTGCVLLRELSEEEIQQLAKKANEPCWCSIPEDLFLPTPADDDIQQEIGDQQDDAYWSDGDLDTVTTRQIQHASTKNPTYFCENEKKNVAVAFEAVRDIPSNLMPETYSIVNILERSKVPPLIVWETARRPPSQILKCPKANEEPLTKEQIIQELKQNLETVRDFSSDHDIWNQLEQMPNDILQQFYQTLIDSFSTANQYIASYNPAISYCTGAHNNAVLLGGDQQAKAATFYLCPYLGKLKFPLQDCLVILKKAIEKVNDHKSVAADSGTSQRKSRHVLMKCLNRLNMQMELSGKFLHHHQINT